MTMLDTALVDQAARDRLLNDLDATFFVEAGAGTGKTRTLVDRIVNLVAKGRVRMEQLATITFTDAAAAELRDRVREGLDRAAERADLPPEERARCRVAAGEIDLAAIRTIHAFAGHLLRTYPLEAGLPPGFGMLDEIEQEAAFEGRFRIWFWGPALEPPARETLRRAFLLGLTQQHLRDLALALEEQHDLLAPTTTWAAALPADPVPVARRAGQELLGLLPLLQYANDGEDDPLAQVVLKCQGTAQRLAAAVTEEAALAGLVELGTLKTPGNQKNWRRLPDKRNACAAIKAVVKGVSDEVAAALAAQRGALLTDVLALLRDFTLAGVATRRAEGVATFQDLLAWARDLLRDHPEVRARAQQQYQRIFVDEFQDTDPLQAEIAFYLAADPTVELPADWRDIQIADGKLFLVGDPKQSIYRFRRADIGVYDGLRRRLAHCQERLVQNFRSVGGVLTWVNHHFEAHILEQEGVQPPYVPLAARWDDVIAPEQPGGVYCIGQAGDGNAAATATVEAEALVGLARSAVADGWPVTAVAADGTRGSRPARYRDICILIPSRTHLRRLERALEDADVPYRVESGKLVLATQEVRDLLACLRAIEDPSDQVALVGALRSVAFGCSDPDLLRWVEGGGRLDYERPGQGPEGPVKDGLACLEDFHRRRRLLSPPALVDAFLRERLLEAAAFGEPRPRESWRRLRYVAARARAFTATGRHTLRAFLEWISGLERAEVREAESADSEPDEDAVRILTIHKSKGLEFPIVMLAGLGALRGGQEPSLESEVRHALRPYTAVEVIANRVTGALACRVGAEWRTTDFASAESDEARMARAEAVRLLYVAATRARDHLVLSLHRGPRGGASAAALIEARLDGTDGLCRPIEPTAFPPPDVPVADGQGLEELAKWGSEPFEVAWLERRRNLIRTLAAPRVISEDEEWLAGSEDADGPDLEDSASNGSHGGLAAEVRRLLRSTSGAMPADADPRAVDLAWAIRASAKYQDALANPTCRHNVSLLGFVDDVVLDLSADLLYETSAGVVLAMYDVGNAEESRDAPEPIDEALMRAHCGLLALAFWASTGQTALAVDVIGIHAGRSVRGEELAELVSRTRASIATVTSSGRGEESETA